MAVHRQHGRSVIYVVANVQFMFGKTSLALVFFVRFVFSIFVFRMSVCFCCVSLVSSVLAKRWAGKNVSKIAYFVSSHSSGT